MQFCTAMSKNRYIAIRNQADSDTLELYFLDVIADNYDWYYGSSSKVQEIIDKVNSYKPSKIKVIIDSEGGDAPTGLAIYNFLKRCDAKVEVEILGLAASIASVIAMAANKGKLRIARNAFIMIHKAEGLAWGTSEEMRRNADLVDKYTSQIVDIYSQRTGKTTEEINALIESGDYWMAGEEAVAMGFADETFNDTPNLQIAARLDPSMYKNIPAQIRAQMKPSSDNPELDSKTFLTNQFQDMKKFFSDLGQTILNSLKGVKPAENNDHTVLMNSIGTAVSESFNTAAESMETAVDEAISNSLKKPEVLTAVSNEVAKNIPGVDFTKDGPAKTALDTAITNALQSVDFTKEGPLKKAFDTAVTNAVDSAIKTKVEEMEKEITNLKAGKTNPGKQEENQPQPIGSFN